MTDQLPQPADQSATPKRTPASGLSAIIPAAPALVQQLVARQAQRCPETLAASAGDAQLTYGQLLLQATALAGFLQTLGVAPDVPVALCLPRSLDLLVSMLGILLAGGAYVPFDPAYPSERLATILADTAAPVLLTHSSLLGQIPATPAAVICLDRDATAIAAAPPPREYGLDANHRAYVIYTSGSTGKPKGVQITHGNLQHLLDWHLQAFPLAASDRTTQIAGIAFDACTWEIWPALVAGASIQIVPDLVRSAPTELQDWLVRQQITCTFLPTPLADRVVRLPWPASAALHTLLTGGEQLLQAPPPGLPFTLINNYGPTETTVVATSGPVPAGSLEVPSIGWPVRGSQLYVLDARLRPVAAGVAGEIYIGGGGVGRGYLEQAALTAERFLPNPFSQRPEGTPGPRPGARMYRSGDQGRLRPDGSVEYIGRLDQQVKVRGFRIELGEIEAVLKRQPGVAAVAVILEQSSQEDKRLLGYVVPNPAALLEESHLRAGLATSLPEYMVPNRIMVLEDLPLTPNGKVDRRRLPIPEKPPLTLEDLPQTAVEEQVAAVWNEVLGESQLGRRSHFLQVGGHSLLATQIVVRLRQIFNLDLPLQLLFERPTIGALAEYVEAALGQGSHVSARSIERISRDANLPLSFAQQRIWFFEQFMPDTATYTIPIMIKVGGLLQPAVLEHAIKLLVERHEVLRTTFGSAAGIPHQLIDNSRVVPMAVLDLKGQPADRQQSELGGILDRSARASYRLGEDALLRMILVQLGVAEAVLVVAIHHIIADAWSIDVLIQELLDIYAALASNQPPALAELPIQYVDFAAWQHAWLQADRLDGQLAYWRKQLEGSPALLELPTDRPRPPTQTLRGAVYSLLLPKPLTVGLKALSRRKDVTLFMLMLAVFKTLLYRYTGQPDLCVGSPIANRTRVEVEHLIGFFINTLVLRAQIEPDSSFSTLLRQVRETTLAAYAHQDLPYEKLIEDLRIERNISYNPLFQVMFNFRNDFGFNGTHGDLTIDAQMLENGTSKFDLTLDVSHCGDDLLLWVEYSTELFEQATIIRMLGHFQVLLHSIISDPDQQLRDLALLTPPEQQQLLDDQARLIAWLSNYAGIEDFQVVVRNDLPTAAQLVVYIVKKSDATFTNADIHAYIRQAACRSARISVVELGGLPLGEDGQMLKTYAVPLGNAAILQPANPLEDVAANQARLAEKRAKLSAQKQSLLQKRLQNLRGE
ncbi:MAG: amino acid adenylation domain-containing protein [Herpetosiphonaceae bacterium]|nr:amino acid adenylation domain-containing protein [Herpetosiphonaceae bacterium]